MRWGEHGHGGFESESESYIQGGQPIDEELYRINELAECWDDFEDAKNNNDSIKMRAAVKSLQEVRGYWSLSIQEEREMRKEEAY